MGTFYLIRHTSIKLGSSLDCQSLQEVLHAPSIVLDVVGVIKEVGSKVVLQRLLTVFGIDRLNKPLDHGVSKPVGSCGKSIGDGRVNIRSVCGAFDWGLQVLLWVEDQVLA